MTDIIVIGAGISGLVCAQQLSQAGYSVLVVEKSRGLGGRVATRRLLEGSIVDHGACYLKSKGEILTELIELLCDNGVLQVWDGIFLEKSTSSPEDSISIPSTSPAYIAPAGMSSIAKFLAKGLNITLNQRVIGVNLTADKHWHLTLASNDGSSNSPITAKAVVIAIPAPQALELLQPLETELLDSTFFEKLRSLEFFPSISVMAGYPVTSPPLPQWNAVTIKDDHILGWIGFDSSKRLNPTQPIFVVQSSANFAQQHLETQDLQSTGKQILQAAADCTELRWLASPEWIQVHRWRYAFPRNPLTTSFLAVEGDSPLVACGDWCGGNLIPGAMNSGIAAAAKINTQLQQRILPDKKFWEILF
ncbi:NAD(P)/FAD-dependent oxidoreductase [Calothrix sp. UHCC 0171]|uniref:NAD(P)/FAD-dependent oxidoreductase n=1 Tax=Calothrix sp. UHCC 0171 TaxID=3110245 RepID=UPI002B213192|nr:FAD-dependent oxidoreductase [Calothrix sp. UHCC 0171]MEA5571470.1 FAD-dependent oxidoreductase [Calothrix sp. UHCC 0171]